MNRRTHLARPPAGRSPLRAVAVPSEHGGWGLTSEPVLLGLLVAPSVAGAALGAAAFVAFVARTPLKIVLVDRRRHRRLPRTGLATRVLAVELTAIAVLVALAATRAGDGWWLPLLAAAPLVIVELAFDMRSRSRRLLPELCGAVGMAAVSCAVARAGGAGWTVALGLWVVLAARSVASIPYTRAQVQRLHSHRPSVGLVDLAQAAALLALAAAYGAGVVPGAALVAVAVVVVIQAVWLRLRPPPVAVLGITQLIFGLAIVLATAASAT
jgi:hypothetical protein